MAVDVVAAQRDEQVTLADEAPADPPLARDDAVGGAICSDRTRDVGQRHRDHDSASRRTSRSSNGVTTPAISCPVSCPLPATTTASPGSAALTAAAIAVLRSGSTVAPGAPAAISARIA